MYGLWGYYQLKSKGPILIPQPGSQLPVLPPSQWPSFLQSSHKSTTRNYFHPFLRYCGSSGVRERIRLKFYSHLLTARKPISLPMWINSQFVKPWVWGGCLLWSECISQNSCAGNLIPNASAEERSLWGDEVTRALPSWTDWHCHGSFIWGMGLL
jgi:hypothetical protein